MKYGLLVCALLMAVPACCMRKKDKSMKKSAPKAEMKKDKDMMGKDKAMKNSKY